MSQESKTSCGGFEFFDKMAKSWYIKNPHDIDITETK